MGRHNRGPREVWLTLGAIVIVSLLISLVAQEARHFLSVFWP